MGAARSRIDAHRRHIDQLREDRDRFGDEQPWAYDNLIMLAEAECEAMIDERLSELEQLLSQRPNDRRQRRTLELERAELQAMRARDQQRRERRASRGPAAAEQERDSRSLLRRLIGWVAVPLVLAVKLAKFKVVGTLGSMLASVAAYALIWGWKFAVGFVALILVHEYGHVLQLRREGIRATAPMFIPFLGAYVGMKELPKDAAAEARVGLAGPVVGAAGCLVPVIAWQLTGSEFWQALAYTGMLINLFNLLPVLPLDGGRAMTAISTRVWVAGYAALAAFTVLAFNPVLLLILVFGGVELWHRVRRRREPGQQAYHQVPVRQRAAVLAVYLTLVAGLGFGVQASYLERSVSDVAHQPSTAQLVV